MQLIVFLWSNFEYIFAYSLQSWCLGHTLSFRNPGQDTPRKKRIYGHPHIYLKQNLEPEAKPFANHCTKELYHLSTVCKHKYAIIHNTNSAFLYIHLTNRWCTDPLHKTGRPRDVIPEASIIFLMDPMRIICMMHAHFVVAKKNNPELSSYSDSHP